jgi:hypothetical protein
MKRFISDNGQELEAKDTATGEVVCVIPRYAVWGDTGRGKAEVIEVSNDLEALQTQYGPDLPVFKTPGTQE